MSLKKLVRHLPLRFVCNTDARLIIGSAENEKILTLLGYCFALLLTMIAAAPIIV